MAFKTMRLPETVPGQSVKAGELRNGDETLGVPSEVRKRRTVKGGQKGATVDNKYMNKPARKYYHGSLKRKVFLLNTAEKREIQWEK